MATTQGLSVAELAEKDKQIQESLLWCPVAGGTGYIDTLSDDELIRKTDADTVVSTASGLASACGADSGAEVIWIEDGAKIDLSGHSVVIESKTVVSGRGLDGSIGALLYNDECGPGATSWDGGDAGRGQIHLKGDATLAGVRLRGPTYDYWDADAHPGYIPLETEENDVDRSALHSRAITVHSGDASVLNCKLYGWPTQGIFLTGSLTSADRPSIRFCLIRDSMMTSYGYGVEMIRGHPTIDYCYFTATRHSICTFGYAESGWTVTNSVFGPSHSSHILDAHGLHNNLSEADQSTDPQSDTWEYCASSSMQAENCTFFSDSVIPDANFDAGRPTWAASIRGVPFPVDGSRPGVRIRSCEFLHDGPQEQNYGIRSFNHPAAFSQGPVPTEFEGDDGFSANFIHQNNQYNISWTPPYREDAGAPVDFETPKQSPSAVESIDRTTSEASNGPRYARRDPYAEGRVVALKQLEDNLGALQSTLDPEAEVKQQ